MDRLFYVSALEQMAVWWTGLFKWIFVKASVLLMQAILPHMKAQSWGQRADEGREPGDGAVEDGGSKSRLNGCPLGHVKEQSSS